MNQNKLTIIWTNPNLEVGHLMVFMYALNAKQNNEWEEIEIVLWGPTVKLLCDNPSLKDKAQIALFKGVKISACKSCATQYNLINELEGQNIEVKPFTTPLTKILKAKENLITI